MKSLGSNFVFKEKMYLSTVTEQAGMSRYALQTVLTSL